MAAPSRVQIKALPQTNGTGTTTVTLDSACAAGNKLILFLFSDVTFANAADPVVVEATPSGGSAVAMTLIGYRAWTYEAQRRVSAWQLADVTNAVYTIDVDANGSSGDADLRGFVVEVTGEHLALAENITFASAGSENGVLSVSVGPVPGSGEFSNDEIYALAFTAASNGTYSDIDWTTPSGWAALYDDGDGTSAKFPIAVFDRTLSTSAGQTVVLASSVEDAYGRAGMALYFVASGPETQQKIRIEHGDSSLNGVSGVTVEVFANPGEDETFTGSKLFEVSGLTWANEDIGGGIIRSVLEFNVPDAGNWFAPALAPLTTGQSVVCGGGIPGTGGDLMGSAGFTGYAVGEVTEEVI